MEASSPMIMRRGSMGRYYMLWIVGVNRPYHNLSKTSAGTRRRAGEHPTSKLAGTPIGALPLHCSAKPDPHQITNSWLLPALAKLGHGYPRIADKKHPSRCRNSPLPDDYRMTDS